MQCYLLLPTYYLLPIYFGVHLWSTHTYIHTLDTLDTRVSALQNKKTSRRRPNRSLATAMAGERCSSTTATTAHSMAGPSQLGRRGPRRHRHMRCRGERAQLKLDGDGMTHQRPGVVPTGVQEARRGPYFFFFAWNAGLALGVASRGSMGVPRPMKQSATNRMNAHLAYCKHLNISEFFPPDSCCGCPPPPHSLEVLFIVFSQIAS